MRRQSIVIAGMLAFVAGSVRAEDAKPVAAPPQDKPAEPAGLSSPAAAPPASPAPAAKPAPPPTPEQAADAALAAIKTNDSAALKALAAKDDPDPWIVADELIRRGELDAAAAFARASPRADVEALPAYVEAARRHAPDTAERELLVAVSAATSSGSPQVALARAASLAAPADTVVRVRLRHARANAFWTLERWPEAAEALRNAADAAVGLGWLPRAATLYMAGAMAAHDSGEQGLALECLNAELSLHRRRSDERGEASALVRIAVIEMDRGNHQQARAMYEEALKRFEALDATVDVVWVLRNSVVLHRKVGEHRKVLVELQRVLTLEDALKDAAGAAGTLLDMGGAHLSLGDAAAALAAAKQALARFEMLKDKAGMASALINVGNADHALAGPARALDSYARALDLAKEAGHETWIQNALQGIAAVCAQRGEHAKALDTFQQLLNRQKAARDERGAAQTLAAIGHVHADRADYSKALAIYDQALARQEALGDKGGAAITLNLVGSAYGGLGDYARALSTYEQVLARMEALGDQAGAAGALINAGNVYKQLTDYAKARSYLERGLALAESIGHRRLRVNALLNLGTVYNDTGAVAEALSMWKRALAEYEAMGDPFGVETALHDIGVASTAMGDHVGALAAYQQALAKEEAIGDKAGEALTLRNLGRTYRALGERDKALASFESSRRAATARRLAPELVLTLTDLARFHLEENASLSLRFATDALREAEHMLGGLGDELGATARGQFADLYAVGALAATRENNAAELLTFLESGRAGALLDDLDQREVLQWKTESLPPDLLRADLEAQEKEREARRAYDKAAEGGDLSAQREAGQALDLATEGVRAVAERIQRALKMQAAFYYPRAKTIEEICSTLLPGQALVLYGLCFNGAMALVLRPDSERIVKLGLVADVVAACEALDAQDPVKDVKPAVDRLRKRLVDPLGLGADVAEVLVSPEGPLCYLPFGALFPQTVALTPSGTTHALLLEERRDPGHGVLALGDPDYIGVSKGSQSLYHRGRVLSALPATRAEVTALGTIVLLGADASEAKFYEAVATTSRWRAVHFACHGLVDAERPMFSSLALSPSGDADGFLTAREIRRTKIPADLAVLSACETATGKIANGEGIRGLTRSFMFAGAPRVICSLWKVDDEATSALMVKFYDLWNPKDGKPGLPTAEALRKAQEFVRSQEKWKHPYFWAAWVLWGLPS